MEKWLREGLISCLGFEIPNEMIKLILALKTPSDLDEYFGTLLNVECEQHRLFLAECKQRLFSKALPNKKSQDYIEPRQNKTTASGGHRPTEKEQQQQQQGAKKKVKYVNLYADGKMIGDAIMLKGRRLCECQATQHQLVSNCLGCGRIVCEQEGNGPCLFCGQYVYKVGEQPVVEETNKKNEKKQKRQQKKPDDQGLQQALEQRDRLLEYERNSEKRTTVIDDEFDYFQENSVWLSEKEREKYERLKEEMHDKKHASRATRKITVDFAGREVDENASLITEEYERSVLKELNEVDKIKNLSIHQQNAKATDICGVDPNVEGMRQIFHATVEGLARTRKLQMEDGLERTYNRVQDKELLEMQDMRKCLSLHQPYASLMVAGIKKHEGRVWYTGHRGRLWIAATSKEPKIEEIKEVEKFYKSYYNDPNIIFPNNYPTSTLLGCVKVEDCLPQEEYREVHAEGESESPYVFICSNAQQLPIPLPIKGDHKIFDIDRNVHLTACKTLMRLKVKEQG